MIVKVRPARDLFGGPSLELSWWFRDGTGRLALYAAAHFQRTACGASAMVELLAERDILMSRRGRRRKDVPADHA